jgi:hypothetical protein
MTTTNGERKMNNKAFKKWLKEKNACEPGVKWVGKRDLRKTWDELDNPAWLGWLARNCGVEKKPFVSIACECARFALPFVKKGENRPLKAIETAEKWIRGEATEAECRTAAYADASAAAYAAAYAATAATAADASAAAYAAAYAAYSAAYAAYAADAAAAKRTEFRKKCCDIYRKHIRFEDLKPQ